MISLVSTVFNDRDGIQNFFAAMSMQTRFPNEIVLVDAGSTDGTWEIMEHEAARMDRPWKLQVIQEIRCNVARGRDLAIEHASGELIVSTDIGCDWDPEWLAELVKPLESDAQLELVIGSWAVRRQDLKGPWALTEWALKGDQRLEADKGSYSSSRSIAYRKSTWEALGRYPEDLTLAADDAVFHYLIEKAGVRRTGAPKVRCYWHRHELLKHFFKESYRYGLGDGEARIQVKAISLIGGRLALEFLGLGLGLGLVVLQPLFQSGFPWIGLVSLGVALLSIIGKVFNMRGAISRLAEVGVSYPLLRLMVLTYGTKLHWLRGFAKGLRMGSVKCRDSRMRLHAMTPQLYRERLCSLNIQQPLTAGT